MVTICWAAKGGSGTTVVTATVALESKRPALLVDLDGDMTEVLGMPPPDHPGVTDWLRGTGAPSQLSDLAIDIDDTTSLLCAGHARSQSAVSPTEGADRWTQLVSWFDEWEQRHHGDVWIDAGTGTPAAALAGAVSTRWLVTRACYLSLRRVAQSHVRPTGVVLVAEAGRSLRPRDIERSSGAPIVATIAVDPKVARAVDAGLLVSRPPKTIRRGLRAVAA